MLWILIIFFISVYFFYTHFYSKRKNLPPGPTPFPFVGNMFQLDFADIDKDLIKLRKTYGNIFTIWMPSPYIIVNDYESLKEFFVKQGEIFAGRPSLTMLHDFIGGDYGLIMNDNSWWKNQRRFALHILRDFGLGRPILENTIIDQANKMVELLDETKSEPIDLVPYFTTSIGNVIFQLVFGYVKEHSEPELHMVKNNIDAISAGVVCPTAFLMELSYKFKKLDGLFGGIYTKALEKNEEIFEFIRKEVDRHRKTINYDEEPRDYIDAFLMEMHKRMDGNNLEEFTDHQLLVSVWDLFTAGFDTTSTTVRTFSLYMLNHREIQEKVHTEIDNVIDRENPITMADQTRLPYLNACIQELLRIAVVVPLGAQHMVLEDVHMSGYRIPKGTIVIPQTPSVQLDEKLYPDPYRFDPERHLKNGIFIKDEKIMPFSLGKRSCLGEGLARMQIFLFLSILFQKFALEPEVRGIPPPNEYITGFLRSPKPFKCRAIRRSGHL